MRTFRREPVRHELPGRFVAGAMLFLFLLQGGGCTNIRDVSLKDALRRPDPIVGVVTEGGSRYSFSSPGWIVRDTLFGPMKAQGQSGRPDTTYGFPVDNVRRVIVQERGISEVAIIAGVFVAVLVGVVWYATKCSNEQGDIC